MPRRLRPMLTRKALLCLACAAVMPATAVLAGSPQPTPVTSTRDASSVAARFRPSHHLPRRERFVRRHFRAPEVIGFDGLVGEVPVPAPFEGDEAPWNDRPLFGFENRPSPRPRFGVGPQIIILPDPLPGGRRVSHFEESSRAAPVPLWKGEVTPRRSTPQVFAHRYRQSPWCVRAPGYGDELLAIALSPCDEAPHAAIYNTPCGVRPYE
jgi:hypothetical protein